MNYDFVVIGSGISGMTAATILAHNGMRVALAEKAPRIAPVLRGFSRRGVRFDTGFHYTSGLGDGEILDRFFRYLGISGDIEKYSLNADHFDIVRDVDGWGEFHFPIGEGAVRAALCDAFPSECEAVDKYLAMVDDACRSIPFMEPDAGFSEFGSFMGVHGPSLQEVLDGLTTDPALKKLLSVHSLLYGVPAAEAPFFIHATAAGLYYRSVHGIKGGGRSLVNAFEKRLAELEVDVFPGRNAEGLRFSPDGKLDGVLLEGGEALSCSNCVATVHPSVALGLVPPDMLRPAYRHRLEGLEETLSAFMLYAVCEPPIRFPEGVNIVLSSLGDHSVSSGTGELEERTMYIAGTAPHEEISGGEGFVAICPADQSCVSRWNGSRRGERPLDYLQFKDEIMERMARHIERCCPELRGSFKVVDGATPLTMRDFASNPKGGLYGVKQKVGQYNPMPTTRVPGFYLAGQSVTAPGVLGGVMSAFLTCGAILGHEQLRKGLKECS